MKHCPSCGYRLVSVEPLTKKQLDVYRFIAEFTQQNGHAPSFEEIATTLNYNSLATVHEHLGNLERKGYISRSFNEARGITCLVHPDELGLIPKDGTDS